MTLDSAEIEAPAERAAGFTLVEVVVAVAIMIAIATVVTPNIIRYLDRTRINTAITEIDGLATAVGRFKADVTMYPRFARHLTTAISSTDVNSCGTGNLYGFAFSILWKGPYLSRVVQATGYPLSFGIASDTLVRTPTTGGTNPTLSLMVNNVRLEDATALNTYYDADGSSTLGTIRWTTAANGLVRLEIVRPISGC